MITLSKRLSAIFEMTDPGELICDIGCDHGYLSIAFLESGKAGKVIASDIGKGPLDHAKRNMSEHGLEDRCDLVLSDGLSHLENCERTDAIVIAGMGGAVMLDILMSHVDVAKRAGELVLSPQRDVGDLRGRLFEEGFDIADEAMICEEDKYYPIIKFIYSPDPDRTYTEAEIEYGPVLTAKREPVFLEYLEKQRQQLLSFADRVPEERKRQIEHTIGLMEEVLRSPSL